MSIFNGTKFTPCTYTVDGETIYGLYIHDMGDEFGNGDGVVADCDMPETEEEAADLLLNETLLTDGSVLATVQMSE